jgi:hypothetical protein
MVIYIDSKCVEYCSKEYISTSEYWLPLPLGAEEEGGMTM